MLFDFGKPFPAFRHPFSDDSLQVHGPDGAIVGGRVPNCTRQPVGINFLVTTEPEMQVQRDRQHARVIGCLVCGQLDKGQRPVGTMTLVTCDLGQGQQGLGVVFVPPRPFAIDNGQQVFPVTGRHCDVEVQSKHARHLPACVPQRFVQRSRSRQSTGDKERPRLGGLEVRALLDQVWVGFQKFDYAIMAKEGTATQANHQVPCICNGPLQLYHLLEKRQQRFPVVCLLQTTDYIAKIGDIPCFAICLFQLLPGIDSIMSVDHGGKTNCFRLVETTTCFRQKCMRPFGLVVRDQGFYFHSHQEIVRHDFIQALLMFFQIKEKITATYFAGFQVVPEKNIFRQKLVIVQPAEFLLAREVFT